MFGKIESLEQVSDVTWYFITAPADLGQDIEQGVFHPVPKCAGTLLLSEARNMILNIASAFHHFMITRKVDKIGKI